MIATTFDSNYNGHEWGADGTVDMWVSKTHAARRESSILSLPTKTALDKNFVASSKGKSIVFESSLCRPKTIKGFRNEKVSFIFFNAFRFKIRSLRWCGFDSLYSYQIIK